jgi:hypothetical protein
MSSLKGWTMPDKAVFGKYGTGSSSDRTNLESTVYLKRGGVNQPSKVVTGDSGGKAINFEDAKKGDVIFWEAKTLCDGDPTSDRVSVVLTYYDPVYIGKLADTVISQLSDAEMERVVAGDTSPVESKLSPILDISQAIKQVYSTTVVTDDEGIAAGEIPLIEAYPYSDYTLTIHYGYSGIAERSDSDKAWEFWTEEVGLMVLEIGLVIAALVATAGTAILVFGIAATAVGLVDLGVMASNYVSNGFGAIDENRKGCLFPAMGWNHTYNFVVDEPIVTDEGEESTEIEKSIMGQIDPATLERIENLKSKYGLAGTSTTVLVVGAGITALMLLSLLIGKRRRPSK